MATLSKAVGIRPVLIIFPGALGDLICLAPTIRAIARRHPELSLELMARTELARFAVGRIGIAKGYSIDRREVSQLFSADGIPDAARQFFGGFERVYSFFAADDPRFRDALISATHGRARFYPFRPSGEGHIAECYLRAIEDSPIRLESRLDLLPSDLQLAWARLGRLGIRHGQFLLILPGSGSRRKNWPIERYVELAERIASRITPVVVFGPAEAGMETAFESRRIPALNELELGELAGMARLARCFIGNDSGAAHLAAAAAARGIVIFGPSDPARWRPLGDIVVIRREPLSRIEVDEVLAEIDKMIG